MQGMVDYSLARAAVLRAFRKGRVSRAEICDAHPDLLRAATSAGEHVAHDCPICRAADVRLVSYVFSDEFPKRENGKVWKRGDLGPLLKFREVRMYTVEVCTECSWNHLRSQLSVGREGSGRGREASK